MGHLGKELAKKAKENKICDEWYAELKGLSDKDKLIDMYIRGIDFCLANDFPSNDYIRQNFKGEMEKYGIFLDDNVKCANKRKLVALGNSRIEITLSGYHISEIFVKHWSEVDLVISDNAFAMVDIFDNCNLNIIATGKSAVRVNKYIGNCKVNYRAEEGAFVKVVEKQKKTY